MIWTEDCERAFENVKLALTCAPILTLPKFRESFEVINDAFLIGEGSILLQGRLIAFESRKFFHVGQNYAIGSKSEKQLCMPCKHGGVT